MSVLQAMIQPAKVNPVNGKAQTLPILNIADVYGRAFHLSWFGFFIAFFSWFAFPPLLAETLKEDLHLSPVDIANSNVIGLTSTLLVRVITGPLCDKYGPRKVMAWLLLAGAVPTALAGTVTNAFGLTILRFFIGILGGTFVPCQVWMTAFFDKNIVGTANALAGGWGNAGGGIVFFIMPAVVEAFVHNHGLSVGLSWRVTFLVVPFVLITATAITILLVGTDCPQGSWDKRYIPGSADLKQPLAAVESGSFTDTSTVVVQLPRDHAKHTSDDYDTPNASVIAVFFSPQTLIAALPYACTFGAEIAVEGVIATLYRKQSILDGNNWPETTAGAWASMFGLLNFVTRPLGGYIADKLYARGSVVSKKWWLMFLGISEGIFFIVIGLQPSLTIFPLIGWMTGLAIAMEMGNGANYALVPHLNPSRNGLVSGFVGAWGNLGGIIFGLTFRFNAGNFFKPMWIIGVIVIAFHLAIIWVPVQKSRK